MSLAEISDDEIINEDEVESTEPVKISPFSMLKAGPEPPFELDGDYKEWLNASREQRKEIMRKQAKIVRRKQENYYKSIAREHNNVLLKLGKDDELKDWKYDYISEEESGICRRFLAEKTYLGRFKVAGEGERRLKNKELQMRNDKKIKSDLSQYLLHYRPPDRRVLIASNLTFNKYNRVPVYCDITKKPEDVIIPSSLTFEYIDNNIVNDSVERNLAYALKLGEKKENQICCDCAAKGKECYENIDCQCFELNSKMSRLQPLKDDQLTEFSSRRPILFKHIFNTYYNNIGFACSELCGCRGKCNNNAMFLIEKNLFPLEIYRSDMEMGFSVRSTVFIPAGTPVVEFAGELLEEAHLPLEHAEYAYQCSSKDDEKWELLLDRVNFEPGYDRLLRQFNKQNFYIDPTNYGNVARMVGHSCCPNMEVVRVYKRSLSPAHVNMIMVTLEDVYPGTPLSIDYGYHYSQRLVERCKCGTFACRNSGAKDLQHLNVLKLAEVIKEIHGHRREMFQRTVLKPMERFRNKSL
ncbi:unnamed protein product [Caenorhabditis brenneri]